MLTLKVKVIPKASKTEIVGWEGDTLKIRLHAIPDRGKANEELIAFLAKRFKVPKSAIAIKKGATSRLKTLAINGIDCYF